MQGSGRCVGGVTDAGTSVRLLNADGAKLDVNAPYRIGELWDLDLVAPAQTVPPHREDAIVTRAARLAIDHSIPGVLSTLGLTPWQGDLTNVFDARLRYTGNRNGFVARSTGVPSRSTWFWLPDRELRLRADGRHYDYIAANGMAYGMSYVGEPAAIEIIPAHTLTRVSLARWWVQQDVTDLEERCYLQLSGWY